MLAPRSAREWAGALRAARSAQAGPASGAGVSGAVVAAALSVRVGLGAPASLAATQRSAVLDGRSCPRAGLGLCAAAGWLQRGVGLSSGSAHRPPAPAPAAALRRLQTSTEASSVNVSRGSSGFSFASSEPATRPRTRPARPRPPAPGASLADTHPHLAAEWDAEDNDLPEPSSRQLQVMITPRDVSAGSQYRAGWRCSGCGHRWKALVKQRADGRHTTGCPECARLQMGSPRPGMPPRGAPFEERRLSVVRPDLVLEWHPENDLTPDDVTYGSMKLVWWRCKADPAHEWEATPITRSRGHGCPYCATSGWAVPPEKSLAALNKKAAAEWHLEKNGTRTPETIRANSNLMCWWQCSACLHEWLTTPNSRTSGQKDCPACARRALTDWNNLEARFPELAKEWDVEANGGLKPSEVAPGSHEKRWWRCEECGHKWQASPNNRTSKKNGCPPCARKRQAEHLRRRAQERRAAQQLQASSAEPHV
eukprot:tig00000430_g641.t1